MAEGAVPVGCPHGLRRTVVDPPGRVRPVEGAGPLTSGGVTSVRYTLRVLRVARVPGVLEVIGALLAGLDDGHTETRKGRRPGMRQTPTGPIVTRPFNLDHDLGEMELGPEWDGELGIEDRE